MNKKVKRVVAAGAAVALSSPMGFGGWAAPDEGEAQATESYRQSGHCVQVVQYGEKPVPVGPVTNDPERDTYAYPVKRINTGCEVPRP